MELSPYFKLYLSKILIAALLIYSSSNACPCCVGRLDQNSPAFFDTTPCILHQLHTTDSDRTIALENKENAVEPLQEECIPCVATSKK